MKSSNLLRHVVFGRESVFWSIQFNLKLGRHESACVCLNADSASEPSHINANSDVVSHLNVWLEGYFKLDFRHRCRDATRELRPSREVLDLDVSVDLDDGHGGKVERKRDTERACDCQRVNAGDGLDEVNLDATCQLHVQFRDKARHCCINR